MDHPPQHPVKTRKRRITKLGAYEVHVAPEGFGSIRHIASGEIMHSRTPPIEEARRLYIEQSRLAERLRDADNPEPLVIWDVGLGAAANAMAAIHAYEKAACSGPVRPMRLVSFENDLDSLKLARINNNFFPYLRHAAPDAILKQGSWQSPVHAGLSWTLLKGDFLEKMTQATDLPDVIFYDMFSSNSDNDHWTLEAFRCLFTVCGGRAAELFTYTCSTAIRAALLVAGFHIAKGRSIGEKRETTIALTPAARLLPSTSCHEVFGADWREKWQRSGAKFPAGVTEEQQPDFARAILEHPQFQRL